MHVSDIPVIGVVSPRAANDPDDADLDDDVEEEEELDDPHDTDGEEFETDEAMS